MRERQSKGQRRKESDRGSWQTMQAAKAWFMSRGDDAFTTTQRAYGAIYGMVQRNAAMLSFVKAFWVMAVVFFLIIPAVAILGSVSV
jgi:hypothetical protein